MTQLKDKEAEEIFNALIDYIYAQIWIRMLVTGEPFEIALANHIKELENEQISEKVSD